MTSLSDRVEAATGPDREIDALIRCALFVPDGAYVEQSRINGAWCIYREGADGKTRLVERPRHVPHETWRGEYTASLDAAMTLVPSNCLAMVRELWDTDCISKCGQAQLNLYEGEMWISASSALAATPALALTAASLRARGL